MEQLQIELGNTYLSFPDGQKLKLRASGGIAWYPEDGADYQALVRCADYAMYSTKSSEKAVTVSLIKMRMLKMLFSLIPKRALTG